MKSLENPMGEGSLREEKSEVGGGAEKLTKEVDTFFELMINRLEKTANGDSSNPDFYDDAEEYKEARKGIREGDFTKAKELLRKEMKYAKRGSYFSGDNYYFRSVSSVYSKIEQAESAQK